LLVARVVGAPATADPRHPDDHAGAAVDLRMPVEIEAFLTAYSPKFICVDCLARMTQREAEDVRTIVMSLLAERRAETQIAECLNCNVTSFAVRRRRSER
jgi:hypothetical protein